MVLCYCNDAHLCPNDVCETSASDMYHQCFYHMKKVPVDENGKIRLLEEHRYGCTSEGQGGLLTCKGGVRAPYNTPQAMACCNDFNYCNMNLTLQYHTATHSPPIESGRMDSSLTTGWIFFAAGGAIFILLLFLLFWLLFKRNQSKDQLLILSGSSDDSLSDANEKSLGHLIEESSGSGSGLPLLVQRTVARQVQLECSVGKGRYGEVWRARWGRDVLAVKIFYTTDEESWMRETEMYLTNMLRHENILGFIACDIKGTGSTTQMWLLTDYHPEGSLHDFLRTYKLTYEQMLRLAHTAASGVEHLHRGIQGTKGKTPIAHRDIKSKNILVKRDHYGWSCCIADFGLAVRKNKLEEDVDANKQRIRVGTKRYMPPEVLEQVTFYSFDSYRMADIYSLGLVLWEIATRCEIDGKAEEYNVPFQDMIPSDPTFDLMKLIVCTKRLRPTLPSRWKNDETMTDLTKIIEECWSHQPSARLPALNIKNRLDDLLRNYTSFIDDGFSEKDKFIDSTTSQSIILTPPISEKDNGVHIV